ncbi:MAG: branched-chain amino acid ABC transporter permease, partial [Lachnospiraceae bacterium]|nr:branched-chain amino acid ABC transporter permease [Lachnospiraceae bacterium]
LLVFISMAASWIFSVLPILNQISSGFRIIILTIVIAGIAAAIRPIEDKAPDADLSGEGGKA